MMTQSTSKAYVLSMPTYSLRWLFLIVLTLFVNVVAFGQAASATWAGTTDATAVNSGNVTGANQTFGAGLINTGFSATNGFQGQTWPTTAYSTSQTNFYQFAISPTTGNNFTISSVSLQPSISGPGTATWAVYYSTSASFTSPVQIGSNTVVNSTTPTTTTFSSLSIPVTNGNTLYIRFIAGSADQSTRNIRVRNLVVSGTTTAAAPTYTSIVSGGDWNTASTWSVSTGGNGVPTAGSIVVVNTNVTAAATPANQPSSITVNSGSTLLLNGIYTNPSGSTVTVNSGGTLAVGANYTNTGSTTINGTFQINQGGFGGGTGAYTYGASSTLIYNHTSGTYGPIDASHTYWPSTSGPTNVTIANNFSGGGISLSVARTVTGVFQTANGVTLNSVALTINGTCRINTGGFFNNAPTYGSSSTLVYNTGATFGRSTEWSATSGPGYPANVQISNPGTVTTLNMGTTAAQCSGMLTVDASTVINTTSGGLTVLGNVLVNGTISLGGDVTTNGNWTLGAAATQTNNGKAVFFTAATGNQMITRTGAGSIAFDYLIVNKAAGNVQLSASPATSIAIASTAGDVLQLLNAGALDLNGQSLTLSGTNGNITVSAAGRSITSTATGATLSITGNKFVTGAGTLSIGANVTTILTAGLDFGSAKTTINGTLQINNGGFANNNAPIYTATSTLIYNGVTGYGVGNEWTGNATTAGTGNPQNVTLTTSSVNMPASATRALAGNLNVGTGSTLNLGTLVGGDLTIGGNLTNSGTFNANTRLVTFGGTTAQTLTGATTFDYLRVNNSAGLTINNAVVVTTNLDLTSGKLTLGANNLTLNAAASISNATATNYIVTNGAGRLVKAAVAAVAFTFPIGLNTTNYTPVTVTNTTGTSNLSVNVGSTITNAVYDATRIVNLQWSINSSAATTATVAPTWVAANQAASFTNTGTGELGIYTTAYATTPVTLNTTTTSASGLAFQNGSNLIVVGNSNAVVCSTPVAPTVTAQPANSTLIAATTNNTTTFSVTATGATAYQWQYSTTVGGTYTNVATGTPTGLTYTNGTTATLNISSNSNTAGGIYYYRCIVTGLCGATSTSNVGALTVYCGSASTNTSFEFISNVSVAGGINQTSTASTYTNYYATQTATVSQGQLLTVTFTAGNTVATDAGYVLADWNQDGDFADAGETSASVTGVGPTYNATITVPATAVLGKTRMRVKFGDTGLGTAITSAPCQSFTYGEVEDYGLLVTVASPPTITSLGSTVGCAGTSITINGTNLNGVTAANVTIGGTAVASITSNTATQIVAVIGSGTTGVVQVTTAGGTATSADVFTVNPAASAVWAATATAVCASASAQTTPLAYTSTSGSPTFYSITWNSTPTNSFAAVTNQANTFNSGSGTISISVPAGTAAGTYTGTISVSNAFGCVSGTSTFTVTVNPAATATASNNGPYCEGSTIQLTGGPAGASSYAWTGPNGYSVSGSSSAGLNENFDGTVTGWSFSGASVASAQVCSGTKSVLFAAVNQAAITPSVTNPNQLSFSIVRSGTASPAMSIAVQISDANPVSQTSGPWTTITTVGSTSSTTCTTIGPLDLSSYTGVRYIRFLDTRASGTQQRDIDDVVLTTLAPSMSPSIANATPAMSGVYTLTVTNAFGCTATATTTVTVDATTVPGTASSSQTICSGATPSALTLNGYTGSIVKWQSATNAAFTTGVVDIANTTPTLTLGALTATTYYRAVVKNGSCLTANSNVVTITVNPTTVAGTVSANQTICYNTATTLTLSGNVGSVVKWQKADDAAFTLNVTDIANTTTSLNTGALLQTTYYRAVVQSGVCLVEATNSVTVSVTPDTTITTQPISQTVCQGGAVTFTVVAANSPSGYLYQWKKDGNVITGETNASYTISNVALADAATYTVEVLGECGGVLTSNGAVLTVNPSLPASVTIAASSASICPGDAVTFTATPTNGGSLPTYQWKVNGTDVPGEVLSTFTTSTLVNGDQVSVVMTSNASPCLTGSPATSNTITITVNPTLTASVVISTASTTVCTGSAVTFTATPTNGGTTPTYQWKVNGFDVVGETNTTFTTSTLMDADVVTVVMTSNATPCLAGSPALSNALTITVTPSTVASVAIVSTATTICLGTSVTFTATPTNGGTTPSYQWKVNGNNVGTDNAIFTTTALANGDVVTVEMTSNATPCLVGSPATSNSIAITVNALAAATISGTNGPALCPGSDITFTVTGTSNAILYYNLNGGSTAFTVLTGGSATITVTGATSTQTLNLESVDNGICPVTLSESASVTVETTTWDGTAWSNGAPSATKAAIIAGNMTITSNIEACSLIVNNNAVVTVASGYNVTLQNALTVASGSSFTVNSNANLIQVNPAAVNSGAIVVKRTTNPLMRLDYVLWGSPVAGQNLFYFSPLTSVSPSVRFYTYTTAINFYNGVTDYATHTMQTGKGYLIRLPFNHPTAPATWTGSFTGVPNNGTHTVTLANNGAGFRYNAVSNPYPSTLDMAQFYADNSNAIEPTLYFWRKTNSSANPSYCSYNLFTNSYVDNNQAYTENPNGVIQVGQGFFVEAKDSSTSVEFNNTQRIGNNANQMFRTAGVTTQSIERNRIWLNLTGTAGEFSQTMVGYFTGGTLAADVTDAKFFNDGTTALHTKINGEAYSMNGRPVPFDATDIVPLTYKVATAGTFSITIGQKDGLFADTALNQIIYLKDNETNTYHNLNDSAYSFSTQAGTFDSRFELVYQNALSNENPTLDASAFAVVKSNGKVRVQATTNLETVRIYDLHGRLLTQVTHVNAQEVTLPVQVADQVLMVQVLTADQRMGVKKAL